MVPPYDDDRDDKRISATTARATYGLTDSELTRHLQCVLARNPHYRSAPPMRLYSEHQVSALAESIQAIRDADAAAERARAEGRAAQRRAWAEERRRAAAELMSGLEKRRRQGAQAVRLLASADDGPMNLDAWAEVFRHAARQFDPRGIEGAAAIARDLGSASSACRDFRIAGRDGFGELAARVQALCERGIDGDGREAAMTDEQETAAWRVRERVVHEPTKCTVADLKQVARALRVTVGGTKAELVQRVLAKLQLGDRPAPAYVSARLLFRVHRERHLYWSVLASLSLRQAVACYDCAAASGRMQPAHEADRVLVMSARHEVASEAHKAWGARFGTTAALIRASQAYRQGLAALRPPARSSHQQQQRRRGGNDRCPCGQQVSVQCTSSLCGTCCSKPDCPRHGTGGAHGNH